MLVPLLRLDNKQMVRTGGENNTTDEFRTVAVQDPIPIQVAGEGRIIRGLAKFLSN